MKTYWLRHLWFLLAACLLFQNSMAAVSAVQMMDMDPMLHHAQMRGDTPSSMDHSETQQRLSHADHTATNSVDDKADCCDCDCQYDCMLGVHSAFTAENPALYFAQHQATPQFIGHLWHSIEPSQQLKPPILH